MHKPTRDPTDSGTYRTVSWKNVLSSYALVAAIPVLLWAISDPLAAVLAATAVATAVVATGYARRLARCVDQCRGFAFDLPRAGRVTVCWTEACDPR